MIWLQKYYRKLILVLLLPLFTVLFSGCYDKREVDELAYPLAIGLDVGEANILRLSLQLAAPLAIGGGGGGSSGGGGGGGGGRNESSSIITVDTPSLYSGLNLINNIISKEINVSHAKVIVISKKLAEKGLSIYLHAFERGREFRPDIFVIISNGPASEYLGNVKPTLESNPSKYYELLLGKKFTSFYPGTRLNNFYFANESETIQPVAILSDIGKYESADQLKEAAKETNIKPGGLEGQYEAGKIPIAAKKQNEVMGMAVFKNGKMIGTANGAESACFELITGDYNYSYWSIPDPMEKDKLVVMNILLRKKPVIKVDLQDAKAIVNIRLDLEGDFTSIQSNRNYEENPEIMERAAAELLNKQIMAFLKRTTDEFNSDICGFGKTVKGKFLTWNDWKNYKWFDKYKDTVFRVEINLNLRRTGLMIRSIVQ
ncbi:MAG: Ger(x)C family spore germination protein [Clostridiaceae bacterium]